mgnify:CR=1 FL=1
MMNSDAKIWILYARFGDGHYQVARALKQRFESEGVRDVELFDPLGEAYPLLSKLTQFIYYASTSHFPKAYGWGYSLSEHVPSSSALGERLHSLGSERLARRLEERRPTAVVQTFPLLTMSYLRRHAGVRIPTFTVLTDYVLHPRWLHPETDLYFVASEELKRDMAALGVRAESVRVSGIPIRSTFRHENLAKLRSEALGSGPARVLVMAGAYGVSGEVGAMVQSLLAEEGLAVSLVCGRNAKLERRMRDRFGDKPRVRIFGYVEAIERLMAESSCLVTKAGGITLSEAAALDLPVVVYRPIPGQEEGNAKYWAGKGRLGVARTLAELRRETVGRLRQARSGAEAGEADAAGLVVDDILSYLDTAAVPELAPPLRKPLRSKRLRMLSRSH